MQNPENLRNVLEAQKLRQSRCRPVGRAFLRRLGSNGIKECLFGNGIVVHHRFGERRAGPVDRQERPGGAVDADRQHPAPVDLLQSLPERRRDCRPPGGRIAMIRRKIGHFHRSGRAHLEAVRHRDRAGARCSDIDPDEERVCAAACRH